MKMRHNGLALMLAAATLGAPHRCRACPAPVVATHVAARAVRKQTFTYKTVGPIAIKADVYRPAGDRARPVVVWIHPGGLILGSREMLPADERDRLLAAGFVVVAIDYRLAPETKLPDIVRDIEDAHRWVRVRGPHLFGADPKRVATMGASAGGYLALMAGARVRPRLQAIVSLYGYGDIAGPWYSRPDSFYSSLPRIQKEKAYRAIGRAPISESPARDRNDFYVYCRQNGLWPREVVGWDPDKNAVRFAAYSPERLATPEYPPTLLLHGDRDVDVPFRMSERMAAVLARQHVEHALIRMEGFNHAFDVFMTYPPAGPPAGLNQPKLVEAFGEIVTFLRKHLEP